jgi:excinuclease ABC subunit C
MAPEHLRDKILNLPESPGVYKYYDQSEALLYIGKAKNLKKRVSSYFTKTIHENRKTSVLVSKVFSIEFTVVESEYDALLLENSLIKEFQPRYNINLKDDKSYPFIKITKERFPRVFAMRNPVKDGSEYFGPYSSVRMMQVVLDLIKKLYPIRNCKYSLTPKNIQENKFRLCLEYHIGNCKGPCVGLQEEEEYNQQIQHIRFLLKGNLNELKKQLKFQISESVSKLAFEDAQTFKNKLDLVEKYQSKSTVVSPNLGDLEVLTMVSDTKKSYVNYLRVAEGMIIQTRNIEVKKKLDETDDELLLQVIAEIRNKGVSSASELVLSKMPSWEGLSQFRITVPQLGDKRKLLELSMKNVLYFKKEKTEMEDKTDPIAKTQRILETMQTDLRLKDLPSHIECFDNSNTQGLYPVSACVVFKDAKASKKEYRHFNIKTVEGPNDFASMEEVIKRRYQRLLSENQSLPQLIIVDGGKGQLSSGVKALKEIGLYGKIAILGIAKRLEELYFPEDPYPLYLDKKSETLKIIQQMRDEAHRFGITHHRNRREKGSLHSVLSQIPFIGEKSSQELLRVFKSVKNIKNAETKELLKVVNQKQAKSIIDFFKNKN